LVETLSVSTLDLVVSTLDLAVSTLDLAVSTLDLVESTLDLVLELTQASKEHLLILASREVLVVLPVSEVLAQELAVLAQELLLVVLLAVVVGAVLPRVRHTAAKVPMNLFLLLLPSKDNALQSVHHALPPGLDSLPVPAPVMEVVLAMTSAASTPVCSITHASHLLD